MLQMIILALSMGVFITVLIFYGRMVYLNKRDPYKPSIKEIFSNKYKDVF